MMGNHQQAVDDYMRSLKVSENLPNKIWQSGTMNVLGTFYLDQGNPGKALIFFTQSLQLRREIGCQKGVAQCLENLGIVHLSLENYAEAMKFFQQSLPHR